MKYKPIIFILIGLLLIVVISTYWRSRKEFIQSYKFVISKVEVTPTKSVAIYKGEKKINLWNFSIRENDQIQKGDILVKDSCSRYLYVYRNNDKDSLKLYLEVEENGIFPFDWFCH